MPPLVQGDAFPRLTLESAAGPLELSGRWSDGPLVTAFMRHFGCEYMGLRVFLGWARAARKGVYVGRLQGDVAQRPGTFVVDSSGKVVLAHYNEHSTDNVPVARVLAAVRQAGAETTAA